MRKNEADITQLSFKLEQEHREKELEIERVKSLEEIVQQVTFYLKDYNFLN